MNLRILTQTNNYTSDTCSYTQISEYNCMRKKRHTYLLYVTIDRDSYRYIDRHVQVDK